MDRTHDDGGVNCGNRHILGGRVEPIPGPTALMLLALQGVGFDGDRAVIPEANDGRQAPLHPRTVASVRYLQEQAQSCSDLEYLCWMILAFDLYREIDGLAETIRTLESRIEEVADQQVRSDIFQPSIVRDVLLILAHCTGQRNVFRLPADRPQRKIEARQVCRRRSFSQRVKSYFRGLCIEAANRLKPTPDVAGVHIAAVDSYEQDLADVLRRQYQHFRERVPLKGKRVVLKPNLVEYRRNRVINTHPHVVAAAIELCKHEGASDIIVAEGPGHWRNVQYLVCESGLGEVLKHYHVPFVDINHDETAKVLNLGQLTGLEYLFFSQTIMTADVVISLPKMKTHHWAGATLAMKNFFGVLSGVYYGWPKNELHWRGIDNSIVDICATRPPDLAIVDGIVGMEGDGPLNGTPKHVGVIVMGTDSVAVDATCCRLMQLDPEKIPYLVMAADRKLGQLRESAIEQLGDRIIDRAQPFETIEMFRHLQIRPVEVA
ncbi:MAG: hypothetical protein KatS3mg105_1737 [Gemmatales bacterium]|nr:MAG: hypothetical protein KatS3mg105_1737 [Gemmatales bacterium]